MQTTKFRKNGKFPKNLRIWTFIQVFMIRTGLITKMVKLGKKGQLTIPKIIRKKENLRENDKFILTQTYSGEIILRKRATKSPEDLMLEAIKEAKKFDFDKAWKEVKEERRRAG